MRLLFFFALLFTVIAPASALAEIRDPYDPFDASAEITTDEEEDKGKSATQLIEEAQVLLVDERPLDARTKLLRALRKNPKAFRAHKLLAGYYLIHVGHFRLSLRYIKRAMQLFEEQNGKPPYPDFLIKAEHAHMLHLLSQIRLNLDNYQGALDAIETYAASGYYQPWYPGSKAWILMKLGKLTEAITTAKMGLLSGAEKGRTLNILGILLSLSGERESSLQIFDQAIRYEFSLGEMGQPATPLNNAGEVFRETFEEMKAERAWLKATGLPDGCEHVLPSLNLAILYLEQLEYQRAKETIDKFEACVAQFPLRNGEEHKALVHLARGRINMYTGHVDEAVEHLDQALQKRQWFGKIGASQEDLLAATMISLAQAIQSQNARSKFSLTDGFVASLQATKERTQRAARSRWLLRRARQILTENLKGIEDIFIRNTDSVLDYPNFGIALEGIPLSLIEKRIAMEKATDPRSRAVPYYNMYRADAYVRNGQYKTGLKVIEQVLQDARNKYDDALKLHALVKQVALLDKDSKHFLHLTTRIYTMAPAALRNAGIRLPVHYEFSNSSVLSLLSKTGFSPAVDENREFVISYSLNKDGHHQLAFRSQRGVARDLRVSGSDLRKVINQLNDVVFSEKLP
jgi:tetratricopeptide (TPR) repeat protein